MFFCGSRVLRLFCHKLDAANAILSVVKNNWNGKFYDFIDLQEKNRFGRSCLVLLKLLDLYLAIIYSWQLSSNSLYRFFLSTDVFPFTSTNARLLLGWRDVNIMLLYFWKFKFNLEHFPSTARFLDFYRLSDYIYLRSS